MTTLAASAFDAHAFEVPFYRVLAIQAPLAGDLAAVKAQHSRLIVDAKAPAQDIAASRLLWALGFRKVCMQITLRRDLREDEGTSGAGIFVSETLVLSAEALARHAANFTQDRFSLDPLLPRAGVQRLYAEWIRNSTTTGRKTIVHASDGFCTVTTGPDVATVDLLSVLAPGRGTGRALLAGACALARERGARHLFVTTECENERAWRLYVGAGFVPVRFTAAFHLVCGISGAL